MAVGEGRVTLSSQSVSQSAVVFDTWALGTQMITAKNSLFVSIYLMSSSKPHMS